MKIQILEEFNSSSYDLMRIKLIISYKHKAYLKIKEYRCNPKEIKKYRKHYKYSSKRIYSEFIKKEEIFIHLVQEIRLLNFLKNHLKEV